MKLKKFAVMALITGATIFAGASSAQAADPNTDPAPPVCTQDTSSSDVVDCVNPTVDDENVAYDSTPDANGCWVNQDGTDVCAKSNMLLSEPTPTSTTDCTSESTAEDVACGETTGSTPSDEPTVGADCTDENGAVVACPDVVNYNMMDGNGMDRSLTMTTPNTTGLLTGFGVIAVLGAGLVANTLIQQPKKK